MQIEIATSLDEKRGLAQVSKEFATVLCQGQLPQPGYEKFVEFKGQNWWLGQRVFEGVDVWAIQKVTK